MKKRILCPVLLLMALMAIILGGGCAFGDRHLTLEPVSPDTVPAATASSLPIQLIPPINTAQKAYLVGYVRNGLGMHTADVFADNNVSEWVHQSIADSLRKAGFKVNDREIDPAGLCVTVSPPTIECENYFLLSATVSIDFELRQNKIRFFNRNFTGKASAVCWAGAAGEYRSVLSNALLDCLGQAMPVIITELAKKQPQ